MSAPDETGEPRRPEARSPTGRLGELARMFAERARRRIGDAERRIEVRRFAGTLRHAQQLEEVIRVAHLTDLHVGRMTPMSIQFAATRLTNELEPDLVLLTGDFVCHTQAWLAELEEVTRSFAAPVVAVLGNHDHWSGALAVRKTLERAGAEVLVNACTTRTIRGQTLQIVGVDDPYTGHARIEQAFEDFDPTRPSIGLSHIGEEAEQFWERGVPLVLAGHTHAGQITFARLNELTFGRIGGHRYVHGLYGSRERPAPEGAVYVGAGLGSSVMPLRLGERGRREVTLFELGVEPGSYPEHHREQEGHPWTPPSRDVMRRRRAKVLRRARRRRRRRDRDEP